MAETAQCPLCGQNPADFFCRKNGFNVFRCPSCTNGFTDTSDSKFTPSSFYNDDYHRKDANKAKQSQELGYDDYYAMGEGFKRTFSERLITLEQFAGHTGKKGKLLDVGCGPGFFLEVASKKYDVAGIELAHDAVEYAKTQNKLNVIEGEFRKGLFPAASFDAVTLFDTIEHVKNPKETLCNAYELLKPGGVLMMSTGDFSSLVSRISKTRWHLLTPPEHLFFFTQKGLTQLLQETGFEILDVRYPGGHFSLDYAIERISKSLGIGAAYRNWNKIRGTLQRLFLPMNLWDVMLIVAKKPS